MKKTENDWYKINFWWISTIVLLFLAVIFITAAILVHPTLLAGLITVGFGFYVVFRIRKIAKEASEQK